MACFIVPGTEAIAVSLINYALSRCQRPSADAAPQSSEVAEPSAATAQNPRAHTLLKDLKLLSSLLWGGCFLLLIEHMWHGEVVPWPPFLTAMRSQEETWEMLHEMATVGTTMAIVVTAAWALVVAWMRLRARMTQKALEA